MKASAALARLWETERRRLALWTPVLFGLAAIAGLRAAPGLDWTAGAAALGVAALALGAVSGLAGRLVLVTLACLALGWAAGGLRAWRAPPSAFAASVEAQLDGVALTVDASASGRPRLLVAVETISEGPAPRRARVTLAASAPDVAPGMIVSLRARLSPPSGPAEPGGFDFAEMLRFQELDAIGVARGPVLARGRENGLRFRLARFRRSLALALRARIEGRAGGLAAALAVGDRSGVSRETRETLRDANLSHLLSISGLHMAMAAGLAFAGARAALAATPWLRHRLPIKPSAAAVGLAAGAAYLALSGGATPTQRAFAMAAVAFVGIMLNRPGVTMRALALAALVILAITPDAALTAGFQLSFAATLALVAAFEAARRLGWTTPPQTLRGRALRWFGALALASLVAGLATAPIAAFHFQRAAPWGLPANLAAMPVMSLVVAPALAAAGLAAPFGFSAPFLWVAGQGLEAILAIAETAAAWPGAHRLTGAARPEALPLYAAGGLWLCLWRGPWRFFGVAGMLTAALVWSAPRPELLVANGGRAIGVMTDQGRAVDASRRSDFLVAQWLRADADAATPEQARNRSGWRKIGKGWRVVTSADALRIFLHRSARPPDASAHCAKNTVLILPRARIRPSGPCLAITAATLATRGALSVQMTPDGPRLRGALDQ